jgi:glutathione S-transferase
VPLELWTENVNDERDTIDGDECMHERFSFRCVYPTSHCYTCYLLLIMSEASTPNIPEWTILYHGGGKFKGRGEFLVLMLEDKGVNYAYTDADLYGPTGMMDCFRGSTEEVAAESTVKTPSPIFFPPAVWHRPRGGEEVSINQVGACMLYLGDILGYAPSSPAERGRATCILLNTLDYISRGRSSFHPIKDSMSYSEQKEEGDKSSLEFTKTSMATWLAHFEKVVKKHGPKAPVAGGSNLTCADFAMFHVLDATIAQFNNEKYEMAWDKQNVPTIKEYHEWIKQRPNLQAYFNSDRVTGALQRRSAFDASCDRRPLIHYKLCFVRFFSLVWRQHDVVIF